MLCYQHIMIASFLFWSELYYSIRLECADSQGYKCSLWYSPFIGTKNFFYVFVLGHLITFSIYIGDIKIRRLRATAYRGKKNHFVAIWWTIVKMTNKTGMAVINDQIYTKHL